MRVDNPSQSIQRTGLEIAIIGQSGRFPGAQNVAQFWQNLCNGAESISHFSEEDSFVQSQICALEGCGRRNRSL
jgi:acyl transferase domain-containing protein